MKVCPSNKTNVSWCEHRMDKKHVRWKCQGFTSVCQNSRVFWQPNRTRRTPFYSSMWFAPNIFANCLTGTFPYVSTVSLAPFLMWALSHWHLYLNQHCPRGTSPFVTYMHTHMHTTTQLFYKIWIDPSWLVGGGNDLPLRMSVVVNSTSNFLFEVHAVAMLWCRNLWWPKSPVVHLLSIY